MDTGAGALVPRASPPNDPSWISNMRAATKIPYIIAIAEIAIAELAFVLLHGPLGPLLGNRYWPTFYLIDKKGFLRAAFIGETHSGTPRANRIESTIERLLAE